MDRPTVLTALALLVVPALGGCLDGFSGVIRDVQPADYIRDDDYARWAIEIDHAAGERPSDNVLSFARGRLDSVVKKPDGIQFQIDDVLPAAESRTWNDDALRTLREDRQDQETGDGTVVTYMAFLDGRYTQQDVLGVAIGYDFIVIFSDRIKDGCAANLACNNANRAMEIVVTHELGHAIGLVNRGVPMVNNHEDPEHPRHSSNDRSVMYYAAENSNLFEFFGVFRGLPDDFDSNDRLDVCHAGGKC